MIILVTGGARSGKSSFAESLYEGREDVVYIATGQASDKEMEARIARHQEGRPPSWRTYEAGTQLKEAIDDEGAYLLDCVTVYASNLMYEMSKDLDRIPPDLEGAIEDRIYVSIEDLALSLKKRDKDLVLVTNEVGMALVPESHIGRVFRDIQGRVNQRLAKLADKVYLVCCGLDLELK